MLAIKLEEYLINPLKKSAWSNFYQSRVNGLLILEEKKTELDEGLQQLKHIIKIGWPETKEVPSEIGRYFGFREELSIQDDILFKGNRVIVPVELRPHMIKQVHAIHIAWY